MKGIKPPPFIPILETNSDENAKGNCAIIPIIIIKEIPFPKPLSVILSPNHITNMVPVVKIKIEDKENKNESSMIASGGTCVLT